MSQNQSPEKKKVRRSLSLSKKKTNRTPKNPSQGSNTSKSPSIIALFKNAPPSKLSCPLCSEMVPRFGLNKHIDEACTKAKQENGDIILVEDEDIRHSNSSCVSPKRPQQTNFQLLNSKLTKLPSVQTDVSGDETSVYFNKNVPLQTISKESDIPDVVIPLGNLSSKLSRRYHTRSLKRDLIKEVECKNDPSGNDSVEILNENTNRVQLDTLHKEDALDKISIPCKKETKSTGEVSLLTECVCQINAIEKCNSQLFSIHSQNCPKLSSSTDKRDYLNLLNKSVDSNTTKVKHKLGKNDELKNNRCKKAKIVSQSQDPLLPAVQCDELISSVEDMNVLDEFMKPFDDKDYERKVENLGDVIEAGNAQPPAKEDDRHPYYLRNFLLVLQAVMANEEDMSLFSEEDIHTLTSFLELSAAGQKLYVRLFQRKLNWIKVNKIEYTEIGSDLAPVIEELVKNGFLQSDSELQELVEALDLLSAPELKTLAKGFHLSNPGAPKQQLVEEFLRLGKQRSIFGMSKNHQGIAAVILKKAKALSGQAVRVCRARRAVFSRVLLLFSLTESMEVEEAASGGHTQLSTVLMVNMGRMTFPEYTVNRPTRIFQDREDLIRYESAMHKLVDIVVAMTNGHWEEAHLLYQTASKDWDQLKTDPSMKYHAELPAYLRCFTVGWAYTRILSRGVEILQRLHIYEEAVELLQNLLSQHIYCADSRGRWWDRLALNLHQHLKSTQKAIGFIMEGLSDPYVRTGHQLSLYQRAVRMRDSPSCKKFRHMFSNLPVLDVEDVTHVTIKGKMYPQTGMGKSVFLMEDLAAGEGEELTLSTVMCSVEELALSHYREQGFDQGIHGEGSTFSTLYGLLMWDIIFMEGIPDVFRNAYQAFPLDLHTDSFFENRRDAIESRLKLIHESSTEVLAQLIADVWQAHEGKVAALVSWERFSSLQQVQSLVSCFGGPFLSGVCKIMSKNIRHCRGGLPDLVVWNLQRKHYKLVEVKGPNDRLSHKQMLWLHELKKLGADVEVCHVVSIGAKSNRVG
ncbi:fanconi-associated nuclease 1 [Bombina bombina]|uniref:fanconi-associated nuclease 1 n=1 Tax=Bombina bombina TaxID=8345 RepID=UPI00235A52A2|nr:fanconi-associated nuclease 1 [Bombina bombina]XP_053573531.1 fanconi-associated nuclease 1 [Bombina bombina]